MLFNAYAGRRAAQCGEFLDDQAHQQHHGNDIGDDEHIEDILPTVAGDEASQQGPHSCSNRSRAIDNGRHSGQSI